MLSCLTMDTYQKRFKAKQPTTGNRVQAQAVGKLDLGVIGTALFQISVEGTTLNHEFLVCKGINDDIMSIGLANQLELSYNASTRSLCSIAPMDNWW